MAETTTTTKKILLKSSDNEEFEVEETVALESQTIKHMIEDGCANAVIPLPNVLGKTLSIVLEYCKKHVELTGAFGAKAAAESTNELPYDDTLPITPYNRPVLIPELEAWKADFIKVDLDTLHDLLLAANYLNVKSLLDLATQTVADMCKGKTPEEIREIFNIKNDFTPEEEEKVRSENQWAFD